MFMPFRFRHLIVALSWLALLGLVACKTPSSRAERTTAPMHDLGIDEAHGGHTIARHVGKSDAELRQRLQDEPNISAASSYTDRNTAERVVGTALQRNESRIQQWIGRGPRRANLVLDYTDPSDAIGRVMYPRAMGSVPCDHAIIVLKADADSYFVLTSYPECRP